MARVPPTPSEPGKVELAVCVEHPPQNTRLRSGLTGVAAVVLATLGGGRSARCGGRPRHNDPIAFASNLHGRNDDTHM